MLYIFSPYILGDMDKQHTEDAKDSESHRVLSVDEKETEYKGVLWSEKLLLGL